MEIRHSDDTGCTISHCHQPGRNQLHGMKKKELIEGSPVLFAQDFCIYQKDKKEGLAPRRRAV